MTNELQVNEFNKMSFRHAYLPLRNDDNGKFKVNRTGHVRVVNSQGLEVNSALRKDEWEMLEEQVNRAQSEELTGIARLQQLGLVFDLPNAGILAYQWNNASQMTRAAVNLSGRAVMDQDAVDFELQGRPVPVIHKEFELGERFLQASRNTGQSVDTAFAFEASRVVAEELERILFAGNTVTLNGQTLVGITNEPNRNTGTAAGDFGTISNIYPTFQNMVSAAHSDFYRGDYEAWVSRNQYVEMMAVYTDGSGQSAMNRVLENLPGVNAVHPGDFLADGSLVLVQMTSNVVGVAINIIGQLVEWMSGDGMAHHFRVMTIAAPIVRSDYADRSGIVHYTGA
jgi:uncharacterized linocin/CFP29 family protein